MAQNLKWRFLPFPLWMETKYPILEEAIWEAAFFVCFYAQNRKISPISMRISHHRKKKKKKTRKNVQPICGKKCSHWKKEKPLLSVFSQIIPSLLHGMWKISTTWGAIRARSDNEKKYVPHHIPILKLRGYAAILQRHEVNFPVLE